MLEEAAASAQRMTSHGDADITVGAFKVKLQYFLKDKETFEILFISSSYTTVESITSCNKSETYK